VRNILLILLLLSTRCIAQNVGIGTSIPTAKLHVSSITGEVSKFNGPNGMYLSFFESGSYRGYIGSYSGNEEDVDFGTGGSNAAGNLNLCIQAAPKLTISNTGKVGIGTTTPTGNALLHVQSTALKGSYFTNTMGTNSSAVMKLESLSSAPDYFFTGLEIDQLVLEGRGVGINSQSGYIGGQFSSIDNNGANQNYGIISNTNSNGDAWGVFSNSGSGASLGGTHIGVYGSATGGITNWAFWGQGNAFLSGGTWQTSDEILKQNITGLTNAGDMLKKLSAKTYRFKTKEYDFLNLPEEKQIGFLASDMEQVFPELVKSVSTYKSQIIEPSKNPDKLYFKSVNYTGLIPVLVAAFNEQAIEIEALKSENKKMEIELKILSARMDRMERKEQ